MATTFSFSDRLYLAGAGTASLSFDVGTDPVFIGVLFSGETLGGLNHCTLDGQDLLTTHLGYASFLGTDVGMYYNASPASMSGTVTFSASQWTGYNIYFVAFVIHAAGPVSVLTYNTGATAGNWYGNNVNSGAVPGYALTAANRTFTPFAGESTVYNFGGDSFAMASLEDVATAGARTVGGTALGISAYLSVVFSTGDAFVQADPFTQTMTMPTPTVSGVDVVKVTHSTLVGGMHMPPPTVISQPNHLLQTVPEHGEMPGRVLRPSGMTRPVLTYESGKPTWVEHDTLVTPVSRLVPLTTVDDSTGEPELVWDDNDELVLTEYFD